jgi:protein-tyrosine phosphatase
MTHATLVATTYAIGMTTQPERHLPIDGTHNFRDSGGYATRDGRSIRWRTLFRSDSHHALTPAGMQAVRDLGVRTSIDLRAEHESEVQPSVFENDGSIIYRQLPLKAEGSDTRAPRAANLPELNRMFLDTSHDSFSRILHALAEPQTFPIVVNCAAGKDRTGLTIALLLELAGVHRDDVVEDYALTGQYAGKLIETLTKFAMDNGRDPAQFSKLMECRPENMAESLAYLDDQHGGAERYVSKIGLSSETITTLREALLES